MRGLHEALGLLLFLLFLLAIKEILDGGIKIYESRNDWDQIELARRERQLRSAHRECVDLINGRRNEDGDQKQNSGTGER